MAEQETTLPKELLEEAAKDVDGDYTLQELDDTAMWAVSAPITAAATAGLASQAEHAVYYAAGIFAGAMMPMYINDGLLDPKKISHWVNVTLPERAEAEGVDLGKK